MMTSSTERAWEGLISSTPHLGQRRTACRVVAALAVTPPADAALLRPLSSTIYQSRSAATRMSFEFYSAFGQNE